MSCVGEDIIYPAEIETADSSNSSRLERTGQFDNSYSSYTTIGTVKLLRNEDSTVTIAFQDDTKIGSGPSLYLILANRNTKPYSIDQSGNSRIIDETSAQITLNKLSQGFEGYREYEVPSEIRIEDYQYVVWYCTYGPIFGYAELD